MRQCTVDGDLCCLHFIWSLGCGLLWGSLGGHQPGEIEGAILNSIFDDSTGVQVSPFVCRSCKVQSLSLLEATWSDTWIITRQMSVSFRGTNTKCFLCGEAISLDNKTSKWIGDLRGRIRIALWRCKEFLGAILPQQIFFWKYVSEYQNSSRLWYSVQPWRVFFFENMQVKSFAANDHSLFSYLIETTPPHV